MIKRPPFDFDIPGYLEEDISSFINAVENNHRYTDIEEDQVIGSTNTAMIGNAISRDQAQWIRWYYLEGGYCEDENH